MTPRLTSRGVSAAPSCCASLRALLTHGFVSGLASLCARVCGGVVLRRVRRSFIVELGIVEATGRAMLSICKPERIKPVNYLSVGFVRANEKALVEHLAARLQQYIAAKLRLSHIVTELQPRIHSQREELAAAAAEHERETTALRLQYEREQAAVAERHHAAVDDLTRLHSEGVAQLQAQLQSNVRCVLRRMQRNRFVPSAAHCIACRTAGGSAEAVFLLLFYCSCSSCCTGRIEPRIDGRSAAARARAERGACCDRGKAR